MSSATRTACGLLLGFLVATATAAAQGARLQFGVGGSLTVPTGDYHADATGDGYKAGWQGLALVAVQLRGSPVGVRLDGTYGENSANDHLNAGLTALNGGAPTTAKTKLLGGSADVTYHFGSSGGVGGYLLGGIGVYNVKLAVTSGSATADTSETKFTWNVGAGVTYAVGGADLFLEARYLDVAKSFDLSRTTFIPITAGVRFGGK